MGDRVHLTKDEIISYLIRNKKEFTEKYGVERFGLFGSYARDEASSDSDVDLTVSIQKQAKTLHTFLSLKRHIENDLRINVDLGLEHTIKPVVRDSIQDDIIYV